MTNQHMYKGNITRQNTEYKTIQLFHKNNKGVINTYIPYALNIQ